jgi:acetyl esterase/lipase
MAPAPSVPVTPALSRRGLLSGLAGAAVLGGCSADRSGTGSSDSRSTGPRRHHYARDPQQYADLRLPSRTPLATIVLIHGGYWQAGYGAELMTPLARKLRDLGYATWNVEYRRAGTGGGYPHTFEDVAQAVDSLPDQLAGHVVVVGHSAGGHLAAWAAERTGRTPGGEARVPLAGVVSLSGLLDLSAAASAPESASPVRQLMGGTPDQHPDRYALADPALLVPASCHVIACQAEDEQVIPTDQASRYLAAARSAGGEASYVALPGNHFDLIDPTSSAFPILRRLVAGAARH